MKKLLLSGFALALIAGTALAQQPPAPETPPPPAAAGLASPPPPPPPGVPPMAEVPSAAPRDHAGLPHGPKPGMERGQDGPEGGPRMREDGDVRGNRPPPPPPPANAAHFRITDGDTSIDLKCAENEPAKACADLLLQVMDRLHGPNRQ